MYKCKIIVLSVCRRILLTIKTKLDFSFCRKITVNLKFIKDCTKNWFGINEYSICFG